MSVAHTLSGQQTKMNWFQSTVLVSMLTTFTPILSKIDLKDFKKKLNAKMSFSNHSISRWIKELVIHLTMKEIRHLLKLKEMGKAFLIVPF